MTAASGIDLDDRNAGGIDAFGVVHGLLIALYYKKRNLFLECFDSFFEQGGFACSGGADEVQGRDVFGFEIAAVAFGELVVVSKNVLLKLDFTGIAVIVAVCVAMSMAMIMRMAVIMRVMMPMPVVVSVVMPMVMGMDMSVGLSLAVMMSMVMIVNMIVTMTVRVMPVIMGLLVFLITARAAYGYHAFEIAASTCSTHKRTG